MTGPELKALRRSLGLSLFDFGRLMGYQGSVNTVQRDLRRYEKLAILPPGVMLRAHGVKLEADAGLLRRADHG